MIKVNLEQQLIELYKQGITLWTKDGQLHYKSKNAKINEKILAFLKQNKQDILKLLLKHSDVNYYQSATRFPLKDIQSAYLIGQQSKFGDVSSHVYFEVKFPKLDIERANQVWNKLIKKHQALRTIIDSWETQTILSGDLDYKLLVNNENGDSHLIREQLQDKQYDPATWPLFDIGITQRHEQSILHLSFDFLILDWTSIWILLKAFESAYFNENDVIDTSQDYELKDIYMQSELTKASSKYLVDQQYWLNKLPHLGQYPQLPITIDNAKDLFVRNSFVVNRQSWLNLKTFAQQHGLTPNTLVLTAFACVVNKWIDQQTFVVNLTTMNRNETYKDIDHIVGDFTSTNLLSINVDENSSFLENASKIQATLLEDLQHNTFTGVDLIREIRKTNSNRLYPIVFTSSLGTGDMHFEHLKIGDEGLSQSPQVFMDCQIMEINGKLNVNIDTRQGIFKEAFINRFIMDLEHMLMNYTTSESLTKALSFWYDTERKTSAYQQIMSQQQDVKQIDNKTSDVQADLVPESLKQEIIDHCQSILQVNSLSYDDNFYNFGADSLVLARLSTQVVESCKSHDYEIINFDGLLRKLLAEPTINMLFNAINTKIAEVENVKESESNQSIGKLTFFKKEGTTLKILFHAGLGTMNCLRYLIDDLKAIDRDALAGITINNQEQYCHINRQNLVKKISESYAEMISETDYESIHLVGYCSGGLVALETANILTLQGIDVEHVTLIDTSISPISQIDDIVSEMAYIQNHFITISDVIPDIEYNKLTQSIKEMYSNIEQDKQYHLLDFLENKYGESDQLVTQLKHFFERKTFDERFKIYANVIEETNGETINEAFLMSSYQVQMASWESAHMVPTTYIGDVTYLNAQQKENSSLLPAQDNDQWEQYCIGNFEQKNIPGNHYDCVEDKDNATAIANLIAH